MKTLIIYILAILALGTALKATDDKQPAPLSNADWNEKTDFAAIRMKYASAPGYNAYTAQIVEKLLISEAMKEWENGSKSEALIKLEKAAETCPLSIEIYRRLADGYAVFISSTNNAEYKEKLGILEKRFRTISEGLLKSIVASGDGKSPKTAYKVISIPEEYMALWYLGLASGNQSLSTEEGITCDVFEVKNRRDGEKSKVYFDITIFINKKS